MRSKGFKLGKCFRIAKNFNLDIFPISHSLLHLPR
jgi:hypothetical protein